MKKLSLLLMALCAIIVTSCKKEETHDLPDGLYAIIGTEKGDIILQLEYEKTPITVANFVSLAEGTNPIVEEKYKGKSFYDGLKFHRVIADFMIQGGDPDGTGAGGPGYTFQDEIVEDLKHNKAGVLSMANAGPGTNGSQFFITHKETPHLDGMHTVFGHVVKGQEVVDAIAQDDVMKKITIVRNGSVAKSFDAAKVFKNAFEEGLKQSEQSKAQLERVLEDNKSRLENAEKQAQKTKNGVAIFVFEKGGNEKPKAGDQVFIDYAGFFKDGRLFDTGIEAVAEQFGALDVQRKSANEYRPIPFKYGEKTGLIPGFIEGMEQLNYGDKALVFIPSHLAYGERGAGNVIPPDTDLVFELHLVKK